MSTEEIAALYWRIKPKPREGTASAAIRAHAQACGLVAFVLDLHPDEVARAVQEHGGRLRAPTTNTG